MIKLSDIFKVITLRNKQKRVELVDPQNERSPLVSVAKTSEEAIQDLLEMIRAVFRTRSWEPLLLSRGEDSLMVYRTAHGWRYNPVSVQPDGITYRVRAVNTSEEPTRKDAERLARHHLARISWQVGEQESPVLLPDDEEGKQDFARWVGFQVRFRQAKEQGYDDGEAHYAAAGYPEKANELRAKRERAEAERQQLVVAWGNKEDDAKAVDLAQEVKSRLERSSLYRRASTLADELHCREQEVEVALTLLEKCGWVSCIDNGDVKQYCLIPQQHFEDESAC
jgi:hypothetical protein